MLVCLKIASKHLLEVIMPPRLWKQMNKTLWSYSIYKTRYTCNNAKSVRAGVSKAMSAKYDVMETWSAGEHYTYIGKQIISQMEIFERNVILQMLRKNMFLLLSLSKSKPSKQPSRWKELADLRSARQCTCTRLHGVTSQKRVTAVHTSNPTRLGNVLSWITFATYFNLTL
jgi:hypothetical protein